MAGVWGWVKKIPDRYKKRSGIALFIRSDNETGYDAVLAVVSNTVQAGLLTPGSIYWLRLPDLFGSVT